MWWCKLNLPRKKENFKYDSQNELSTYLTMLEASVSALEYEAWRSLCRETDMKSCSESYYRWLCNLPDLEVREEDLYGKCAWVGRAVEQSRHYLHQASLSEDTLRTVITEHFEEIPNTVFCSNNKVTDLHWKNGKMKLSHNTRAYIISTILTVLNCN